MTTEIAFEERAAAWLRVARPDAHGLVLSTREVTATGYSNAVHFVDLQYEEDGEARTESLVFRMAPDGPSLFPRHDLEFELAVQLVARDAGVPTPHPQSVVVDLEWFGRPFMVMPLVDGHCVGDVAVADPWLQSATPSERTTLQLGFLRALASVHGVGGDPKRLPVTIRGVSATLSDEVAWWEDFVRWSFGDDGGALLDVLAWCGEHRPPTEPPPTLLWGDVRLGNVVFGDDHEPKAVLDWEMAFVGPAEHDIAWYTAMDEMTASFVPGRPEGFLSRDEVVAHHGLAIGRRLSHFRWYEVFAMARASAINARERMLSATRAGRSVKPVGDNAVLGYTRSAIAGWDGHDD